MTTFPPPPEIIDSLNRWFEDGLEPGSFLAAVLCNDLLAACERADSLNRLQLWNIVHWCANNLPAYGWGDDERYERWRTLDAEERARNVKAFREARRATK